MVRESPARCTELTRETIEEFRIKLEGEAAIAFTMTMRALELRAGVAQQQRAR